jgi:hypothetical protein
MSRRAMPVKRGGMMVATRRGNCSEAAAAGKESVCTFGHLCKFAKVLQHVTLLSVISEQGGIMCPLLQYKVLVYYVIDFERWQVFIS